MVGKLGMGLGGGVVGWLLVGLVGGVVIGDEGEEPVWVEAMREVHARHGGEAGVFGQFGDSITHSMAFWAPLQWKAENLDAEGLAAYELVKAHQKEECFRWKGPERGNQGGMTARWAAEHIAGWLEAMDPEVVVLMFGTNDLRSVPLEEHVDKMREVIGRCLDNGTVVLLTTIPPRSGMEEEAARFAEAQRGLAAELGLPLVDYHAEVLARRPEDWDGAMERFQEYEGYEVPTLIARDGVHPSNPKEWASDHSEEGLARNGFTLRNHLTMVRYAEVIREVLRGGE